MARRVNTGIKGEMNYSLFRSLGSGGKESQVESISLYVSLRGHGSVKNSNLTWALRHCVGRCTVQSSNAPRSRPRILESASCSCTRAVKHASRVHAIRRTQTSVKCKDLPLRVSETLANLSIAIHSRYAIFSPAYRSIHVSSVFGTRQKSRHHGYIKSSRLHLPACRWKRGRNSV